jgi:hypothetical protein
MGLENGYVKTGKGSVGVLTSNSSTLEYVWELSFSTMSENAIG